MPRGDRTGPDGFGPMTGRGTGFCNGFDRPGYMNAGRRLGRSFSRGFRGSNRQGFRNQEFFNYPNYPTPQYSVKDEEKYLESEMDALKNELKAMEARLSELKKDE